MRTLFTTSILVAAALSVRIKIAVEEDDENLLFDGYDEEYSDALLGAYLEDQLYSSHDNPYAPDPYHKPPTPYTAPSSHYSPPASSYTAPSSYYSPPASSYTAPSSYYTPPASSYTAPSSYYTPPASSYSAPSSHYTPTSTGTSHYSYGPEALYHDGGDDLSIFYDTTDHHATTLDQLKYERQHELKSKYGYADPYEEVRDNLYPTADFGEKCNVADEITGIVDPLTGDANAITGVLYPPCKKGLVCEKPDGAFHDLKECAYPDYDPAEHHDAYGNPLNSYSDPHPYSPYGTPHPDPYATSHTSSHGSYPTTASYPEPHHDPYPTTASYPEPHHDPYPTTASYPEPHHDPYPTTADPYQADPYGYSTHTPSYPSSHYKPLAQKGEQCKPRKRVGLGRSEYNAMYGAVDHPECAEGLKCVPYSSNFDPGYYDVCEAFPTYEHTPDTHYGADPYGAHGTQHDPYAAPHHDPYSDPHHDPFASPHATSDDPAHDPFASPYASPDIPNPAPHG